MAVNNLNKRVAYGLTDPLLNSAPLPIVSQRAPTANDKAEIGTEWIDQPNNAVYVITSIVANMANWEPVGGGSVALDTLTGDSGGAIAPVGGNIDILGGQGTEFVGTAGTLTLVFDRLELGESGSRLDVAVDGFSADGNVLQVYAETTGGVATTSYTGILSDLLFLTGDGTPTGLAGDFRLTVGTAGNVAIAAGSESLVTQSDGSVIVTTCAGAINSCIVNEAGAADQAQTNIAGSIGFLSFGVGAGNPTATRIAAIVADVALDPQADARAHGVLVTRSGAGAGVAAGAAFKVLNSGAVDNWSFGLDLYNGSAQDYGTADLRFWNQSTVVSAAGNVTFTALAGADWVYVMGDAAGANVFRWEDSGNVQQMSLDSDGSLTVRDDLFLTSGSLFISTATEGITVGGAGGPQILAGAGSPNGVLAASKGSLFLANNGSGVNDRAYINTDGAMAWTAIVTVA